MELEGGEGETYRLYTLGYLQLFHEDRDGCAGSLKPDPFQNLATPSTQG